MSRVQLALNVDDLDEAIAFYTKLFGTEPAKRQPGYANFAVAEPPLKLVLLENPGQGGSVNHLGVEVADADTVDAEQTRLAADGLASIESATPPAATPSRTSSGSRAHPTASSGRSTPSSRTARPPVGRRRTARAAVAMRNDLGRASCRVLLTDSRLPANVRIRLDPHADADVRLSGTRPVPASLTGSIHQS